MLITAITIITMVNADNENTNSDSIAAVAIRSYCAALRKSSCLLRSQCIVITNLPMHK